MQLIEKLYKLSKDRIYCLAPPLENISEMRSSDMELLYPKLSGKQAAVWAHFKERIEKKSKEIGLFKQSHHLILKFESQPKMLAVAKIISEAKNSKNK
jgi:hypothetical protein